MNDTGTDAVELLRQAVRLRDDYLAHALARAEHDEQNPAAMIYALLDAAMLLAKTHFPGNPESLYAAATQMVFEAHFDPQPTPK